MYDSETLRPLFVSVIVYNVLLRALPSIFKEPTGTKVIDDMMMLVVSQKGLEVPGSLFIALIVLITGYFSQTSETL
jgi:hypothetical protein